MFFSVLWILYHVFYFQHLILRPEDLFIQKSWFGNTFLGKFPSPVVYYGISFTGIFLIGVLLLYKDTWIIRILISFTIIWINAVRWSSGGESHSSALFILAHILGIFVPVSKIKAESDSELIYKTTCWYYTGLLATYFLSGFWKILSLIYKSTFKPDEMNWLNSKAALYTSMISYHNTDLPADRVIFLFSFPLVWQTGFVVTCIILLLSIMAATRQPLFIWTGIFLILFHQINNIAFNVVHYVSSAALVCLFFPFYNIKFPRNKNFRPVSKSNYYREDGKTIYERVYSDGNKDVFIGFYAYREKITDRNRLIGGILYLPLIDVVLNSFWERNSRRRITHY